MKLAVAAGLAATAVLTGCGGGSEHANKPRPPVPLVVSVAIAPNGVTITPRRVTAGPLLFTITNTTGHNQQLEISQDAYDTTDQYDATSDPIQPNATSNFSTTLNTGSYSFTAANGGLKPATLVVGKERKNSSNQLLIP